MIGLTPDPYAIKGIKLNKQGISRWILSPLNGLLSPLNTVIPHGYSLGIPCVFFWENKPHLSKLINHWT